MSLSKQISSYLTWLISATRKVFSITPSLAGISASLMLISNISLTVSFFLPLKVIILLGSNGVPGYFKRVFGDIEKYPLIVSLSFAAVGFYALYAIFDLAANKCVASGSRRLLAKSKKIALFENEAEVAQNLYGKLCSTVCSLVFLFAGFVIIFFLDLYVFLGVFGFLLFSILIVTLLYVVKSGEDWLGKNYNYFFTALSGVGFLLVFGIIVLEFILGVDITAISAVISLMLARQMLVRFVLLISDAVTLTRGRLQFNSLFYNEKKYSANSSKPEQAFWQLLEAEGRCQWIDGIVKDVLGKEFSVLIANWQQLGISKVVGFNLSLDRGAKHKEGNEYFLKLYGPGRRMMAEHEASLLVQAWAKELPTPQLLGVHSVDGFECLILSTLGKRVPKKELAPSIMSIVANTWAVEPESSVIERYCRSKPMLFERLGFDVVKHLKCVASDVEQKVLVERFESNFMNILEIVSKVPLFVYNPDMSINSIFVALDGRIVCPLWGNWVIEPVGFGWRECDLEYLGDYLTMASEIRDSLKGINVKSVRLVALLFLFERHLNSYSFSTAIELVPRILDCTNVCGSENCLKA